MSPRDKVYSTKGNNELAAQGVNWEERARQAEAMVELLTQDCRTALQEHQTALEEIERYRGDARENEKKIEELQAEISRLKKKKGVDVV